MKWRCSTKQLALCTVLALSGVALDAAAATPAPKGAADSPTHGGVLGDGMMGGDMMDMMHSCQSMMGNGAGMGAMGLPRLPPGNEKLQAQMQAEMLQKMGEIAARYAQSVQGGR